MTASALADEIVIGGEDGYYPYETLDESGQPVGFNVDLMRAIAGEMGVNVRFEIGPWDEVRNLLESGGIDVLGMFVSEQRAEVVQFAKPHVIVHHRIFIPVDAEPINSINDLAGKTVIVQRAAYSHEYLQQVEFPVELELVNNDAEGLRLLARGNHDAALLTEHRSRYTLREQGVDSLTISGPPVLPVEYAFAVRRGNDELLALINSGLNRVTASGEFDRIFERWLQPYDSAFLRPDVNRMLALFAAVVIVLALLTIWQMRKLMAARAEKREAQHQLAYLRRHDALTGMLNRLAFEHHLSDFLSANSMAGKNHALLSINLDQFRLINENFGHTRADRMLRQLAGVVGGLLPENAVAARLGGDEFAVLLPETGSKRAMDLSKALLSAVRATSSTAGIPNLKITCSIGVVVFDGNSNSTAQLLRRADCACLAAKEDGGDRAHEWRQEDRRLAERSGLLRWVGQIQSALHEDRLLPYWQLILPAREDSLMGQAAEILARIVTPGGDVISAGQFMPAAERYFLSSQIDRWVIDYMLDWLGDHPVVTDHFERININLSGRSLGDSRFLEFFEERLADAGQLINKLCFEITETALIANLASAREVLHRVHQGGCRFALDDFGIGLSSISYLKDLPVDYLKIDGSFVRDIDQDPEALEMIREINRLGHIMGKITVAEHVETVQVRKLLRETGVDYLQGYLVGRPAPLEELIAYCRDGPGQRQRQPNNNLG